MKVLSLWQPWASAVVWGEKRYETRAWRTSYRGWLVIHAASHRAVEERYYCARNPVIREALRSRGVTYDELPRLTFLAVVRLLDVRPVEELLPDGPEAAWGDWARGRYAWQFADVRPLPITIQGTGRRGLWDAPDQVVRAARAVLGEEE